MNGRYFLLATRIEQTIADLDGLVSRAQMQLEKAKLQADLGSFAELLREIAK